MRITNGMMHSTYMSDLQNNLQRLYTAQMQQATGKRIQRLSDDPVGLIQGLNARQQLSRIEQFQRNITDARRWLEASEDGLSDMSDIAKEIYELAVYAGSDTVPDEERKNSMAPKARMLLEQLIACANDATSDEYTFGGFNLKNQAPITQATADQGPPIYGHDGTTQLFNADGTAVEIKEGDWLYNGVPLSAYHNDANLDDMRDKNTLEIPIGFNINMPVTMTAPEILVYQGTDDGQMKNFIEEMEAFVEKLESGCSAQEAAEFIQSFQDAQANVDSVVSMMGGRTNRVDMMETSYAKDELMYSTVKSTLEDMDIAEAIMNMSMKYAVYNASLQLGPKVIQPTLMDYLR